MAKKQNKPEVDPIPQETVDRMMIKCGRRCCICRRFRPIRLQVHHIIEQSDGGTHDEDNLIVTCQTCHTDVHSHVPFMRRFTVTELKGHRDALVKLVEEGKLPENDTDDTDEVIARVVRVLASEKRQGISSLIPEAVELLLGSVSAKVNQGNIMASLSFEGLSLTYGDKGKKIANDDGRGQARHKKALRQLEQCGLIEEVNSDIYEVTDEGYLAADELEATSEQ